MPTELSDARMPSNPKDSLKPPNMPSAHAPLKSAPPSESSNKVKVTVSPSKGASTLAYGTSVAIGGFSAFIISLVSYLPGFQTRTFYSAYARIFRWSMVKTFCQTVPDKVPEETKVEQALDSAIAFGANAV